MQHRVRVRHWMESGSDSKNMSLDGLMFHYFKAGDPPQRV